MGNQLATALGLNNTSFSVSIVEHAALLVYNTDQALETMLPACSTQRVPSLSEKLDTAVEFLYNVNVDNLRDRQQKPSDSG